MPKLTFGKMRYLPKVTQQIKSKARIETHVQLKPRTLTTVIVENKLLFHYFSSLWKFFSAKSKNQGFVTDHQSSG